MPAHRSRTQWMLALKFVLSGAALWLLFRFVHIAEVGAALSSAAPMGIVLGLLLNLATRFAAAARTSVVSRAAELPLRFGQIVQALFIANFWSLALPGVSAGTVATVWRYRGGGAGVVQSVAVLAASRLIELLAFCLLALAGLAMTTDASAGLRGTVAALLAGIVAAVMLGFWIVRRLPPAAAGTHRAGGILSRIRDAFATVLQLLRSLPRRALRQASAWALLQAALDAATVLALALALGIHIGPTEALWINALSYLAILLPISAAGLGMREVAVLAALVPLGVNRADALALALLMLAMTLFNALAGAVLQVCTRPARDARASGLQPDAPRTG